MLDVERWMLDVGCSNPTLKVQGEEQVLAFPTAPASTGAMNSVGQRLPINAMTPSVVSPKWLVFCGKGFSVQARRERRAYPEVDL